jgi:hypothetical protein
LSDTKNKFNSEAGYDLQVDTAKISIDFDTNVGNPVNTVLGHNGTEFILVDQNLFDSTNVTPTSTLGTDNGTNKGTVKTYVFEKLVDPSVVGCANCDSNTNVYDDLIVNGELPIINREIIAEFEIEPEAYHSLEIDLVGHRRVGVDGSRVRTTGTKSYDNCIAGGIATTAAIKDGGVLVWGAVDYNLPTTAIFGVTAIAGGSDSSSPIALKNGGVLAWGLNNIGQRNIPSVALSGVVAIAMGEQHNIALKSDGKVWAWGKNNEGQCQGTSLNGVHITSPAYFATDPVQILGVTLSGVTAIAANTWHTIALKNTGEVVAWGGIEQLRSKINTIPLEAQSGVTAIAIGQGHAVALKAGKVLAWGDNDLGQCNVPVEAQSNVIAIACGGNHTIALKSDGKVLAWGYNGYGQLDIPASANSGVSAIAGGRNHTIALKDEGVLAWGRNDDGQCNVPVKATSEIYTGSFKISSNSYNSYIDSEISKAPATPSDLHISGNATTGFPPYKSLTAEVLEANHPFLDYSCCPCCDAIESGDPAAEDICNNYNQYFITPSTTYYDYCAVTTRKYLDSNKNSIENITQCELLKRNKDKYGSLPNTTLPNCNT